MAEIFYIKRGDTDPAILYDLKPSDMDITGATAVVFSMRARGGSTPKVNRAPASIVSPSGPPTLRYDWAAPNTDTADQFEAEFEVTRADGSVGTFPNDSYLIIKIIGDIA